MRYLQKHSHNTRGQSTIEYIMILAASLMVVALVAYFLMNNVLAPQTKQLGNQSDEIKDYKKQLQQQTQGAGPTPTPTPSPSTASGDSSSPEGDTTQPINAN